MNLEELGQLFLNRVDVVSMLCTFALFVVLAKIIKACVEYKSIKPEVNYVALVKCIVYGFFLTLIFLSEKLILKQSIKDIGFMNYFAVLFATIEFVDNACEFILKPVIVFLRQRLD